MNIIGPLAAAAFTIVNLIVLGMVLSSLFRRTRAHH